MQLLQNKKKIKRTSLHNYRMGNICQQRLLTLHADKQPSKLEAHVFVTIINVNTFI